MNKAKQKPDVIHFFYQKNEEGEVIRPENMHAPGHVYMHGDLEDECGWDIPFCAVNFREIEDGIYPATFNGEEGYSLYYWQKELDINYYKPRGLLVRNADLEAARYAAGKMNENAEYF